MLTLWHSNRLERLADRLAEALATRPAPPLVPECIMVQHPGTAQWLRVALAARLGIAANIEFLLPGSLIWRLLRARWPDLPAESAWGKGPLTLRVLAELPALAMQPEGHALAAHLQPQDPARAFELASRIADVFDQYQIYRPALLADWEAGKPDGWQALLWRQLTAATEEPHRGQLLTRLAGPDGLAGIEAGALPMRLGLFGISTLPPAYLAVLDGLGARSEVTGYLLNPCAHWWADIVDARMLARLRRRWRARGLADVSEYYAGAPPLLASLGRQQREFLNLLQQLSPDDTLDYQAPEGDSLLARLQRDLLEFCPPAPAGPLAPDDRSLQVHDCHGPLREVQVLHDQLLARFDADASLGPEDVLVMAPNIDDYAPHLAAVFDGAPPERHLPWMLADRHERRAEPLLQAVLDLLALPQSRFTAGEVVALLEQPALMRRLRLTANELGRLRGWIRESGVRWGLDAQTREELDLPPVQANTWRFGLQRLLLGYAMGPHESALTEAPQPFAALGAEDGELLGRLTELLDTLQRLRRELRQPRPATAWPAVIEQLLALFEPGDEAERVALQAVREAIARLAADADLAAYDAPLELAIVRAQLQRELDRPQRAQRFLTGQITCCSLQPMRSLPFRLIVLLGLNDGAFPRQQPPVSFDLMAAQPQPGDRRRRDEDRQLFLEALVSAREMLYLSYQGRDPHDNSPRLPSSVIDELLDTVAAMHGESGRAAVLTRQPLQPFSAAYAIPAAGVFTYAAEWLAAPQPERPFAATPLPAPTPPLTTLSLDELQRFLRDPVRHFLRQRLDLDLSQDDPTLSNEEIFQPDRLASYALNERLLRGGRHGERWTAMHARLRGEGRLPAPPFDALLLDERAPDHAALQQALAEAGTPLPPCEVDIEIDGVRLTGHLEHLTREGNVHVRAGKLRPKDRPGFLLEHLLLQLVDAAGCPPTSRFLILDATAPVAATLSTPIPVETAHRQLAALIGLYRRGLCEPLPVLPRASEAYAAALAKAPDDEQQKHKAMAEARAAWEGNTRSSGEREDPAYRLAFRGRDPLAAPDFGALAWQLYGEGTR